MNDIVLEATVVSVEPRADVLVDAVNDAEAAVLDAVVRVENNEFVLSSGGMYGGGALIGSIPAWVLEAVNQRLTTGDGNIAGLIADLGTAMDALETGVSQSISNLEATNLSQSGLITGLRSDVDGNNATIMNVLATKVTDTEASALAVQAIRSEFGDDVEAFVSTIASSLVDADSAIAQEIDLIRATVDNTTVQITAIDEVVVSQGLDLATLLASNDGVVETFYSDEEPTAMTYGDWWVDTNSVPTKAYRYEDANGLNVGAMSWVDHSSDIVAKAYIEAFYANAGLSNIIDGTTVINLDNALIGGTDISTYVAAELDKEVVIFSGNIPPRHPGEPGGLYPATAKENDIYIEKAVVHGTSGVAVDVTNTYRYSGTAWVVTGNNDNITALADMADGKRTIYRGTAAPSGADVNDIWIPEVGVTGGYVAGELYQWTGSAWLATTRYTDDTAVTDFIENTFLPFKDLVDAQLDNQIVSWFKEEAPTLLNEPYTDWLAIDTANSNTAERDAHLADLYYDTISGIAYRFGKNNLGVYSWGVISDSGIGAALLAASNAQDTADGKRRVFISKPTPPYDIGDLYVPFSDDGIYLVNDIWVCKITKAEGTQFAAADWKPAAEYNALSAGITAITATVGSLQTLVDKKIETFHQSTVPHPAVTLLTTDPLLPTYETYVKDIWYDTANTHKTYIYLNEDNSLQVEDNGLITTSGPVVINLLTISELVNDEEDLEGSLGLNGDYDDSIRYFWEEVSVPDEVFDKIDGKKTIYVAQPTSYAENDIWIPSADVTITGTVFLKDSVYISTSDSLVFNKNHWRVATKYTDDTRVDNIVNGIEQLDLSHHVNTLGWQTASMVTNSIDEALDLFLTTTYANDISDIFDAVDLKAVSYFQATEPFAAASGTLAQDGDIWWNSTTKLLKVYKFSTKTWDAITDPKAIDAYDLADEAKAVADGKITSFSGTALPVAPYDIGDVWMAGPTGDIKVCDTARTTPGTELSSDWELAGKYTDDTKANQAYGLADGKIKTWFQDNEPTALQVGYEKGDGDFWVDTNNGNLTKVWKWVGSPYPSGSGSWVDTTSTVANQALEWSATASKLITAPDGSITGWEFSDGSNTNSEFTINADKFKLVATSQGVASKNPFTVNATTGDITFVGKVSFNSVTDVPALGSTPQQVVDAVNAGNTTTIDGGKITTGTVAANVLKPSVGSTTTWTGGSLQSSDFTTIGGAGFRLKSNATGTSADPAIYGAYISGGTLEGSYIKGGTIDSSTMNVRKLIVVTDAELSTKAIITVPVTRTSANSYYYAKYEGELYAYNSSGVSTSNRAASLSCPYYFMGGRTYQLYSHYVSQQGEVIEELSYKEWVLVASVEGTAGAVTVTVNGSSSAISANTTVSVNGFTFHHRSFYSSTDTSLLYSGIFLQPIGALTGFTGNSKFSVEISSQYPMNYISYFPHITVLNL